MSVTATAQNAAILWTNEPASRPDRARIRARIGELHCSLCTGTIEKALKRKAGVDKVAVSLTHEQALVEYDPQRADPADLLQTLRDIGYTLHDPRKLRTFEDEELDLLRESRRFVAAIPIIADPAIGWIGFLPALVCLSLGTMVFVVLKRSSVWIASIAAAGLTALAFGLLTLNLYGYLGGVGAWIVAALALVLVFGVGRPILFMAIQALRRGILNQHVLLEMGAFAGIAGGAIGLIWRLVGYPTAEFFAVSVMVTTYLAFDKEVVKLSCCAG